MISLSDSELKWTVKAGGTLENLISDNKGGKAHPDVSESASSGSFSVFINKSVSINWKQNEDIRGKGRSKSKIHPVETQIKVDQRNSCEREEKRSVYKSSTKIANTV